MPYVLSPSVCIRATDYMSQVTDSQPNRRIGIINGILFIMVLLFIMGIGLSPRFPLQPPPGKPWLATTTEQDKAEAAEIHDIILTFRPVIIGDPITGAEYRYIAKSSCWKWGGLTAVIFAVTSCLFVKKRLSKISRKRKILFGLFCTFLPASLAFAIGYAASYYFGGPYNYENYSSCGDSVLRYSWNEKGLPAAPSNT